MKKIMFYINTLKYGGAERVISNLASDLLKYGYNTVVVTSIKAEEEYSLSEGVKRINLDNDENPTKRIKRNISAIKKLRKICKEEKPDLLISFMLEENLRALLCTVGLPIKNLVSVRNDPNQEHKGLIGWVIGKLLFRKTNGCVFQTEDAQKWFPKSIQKKSRIIFNAVNPIFYDVYRNPKKHLIVTCGRLEPQKNHKILIEAFSKLVKEYTDLELIIYGKGYLEEELKEKIELLGLQNKVTLGGRTTEMPKVLSSADIFVLTSDFEGMPNVLMEAMASGTPSISTNCPCGGPKTLFGEELSEWLVPINDETILVEKIKCLLDMDTEKKIIGRKMKNRAEVFNPNKILKEWIEYIEYIIKL